MAKKVIPKTLTGVTTSDAQEYEIRHWKIARDAAAQGMVLLKNEGGLLPLPKDQPVALYGAGAVETIKGGSGSGDVNARGIVSIWQGLKEAGYQITTEKWLTDYQETYRKARLAWRDDILTKAAAVADDSKDDGGLGFFMIYSTNPFQIPSGKVPRQKADNDTANTAIYVLSRTAGEGADRHPVAGDYYLTDAEEDLLGAICSMYDHVVLILNTGGLVDLGFTDEVENLEAILYIHQPGMEAGNAVADVLSGVVNPSAKLTDTWAYEYEDYPNAETFSHMSGDVSKEKYEEGIYVGYRYFDTFDVKVRYPFGYGLSYTTFAIRDLGVVLYGTHSPRPGVYIKAAVTNTGKYEGKEVVQVYVSCPQEGLEKEYRRLIGFAKTQLLAPGETQTLTIRCPFYTMASFDESNAQWVMEKGSYIIQAGPSLQQAVTFGSVEAAEDIVFTNLEHICPLEEPLDELTQPEEVQESVKVHRAILRKQAEMLPSVIIRSEDLEPWEVTYDGAYDNMPAEVLDFVETLDTEELILLATGDIAKGQGDHSHDDDSQLGSAGTAVPGSAAQTSDVACDRGLADIVLADGPAGLRLSKSYQAMDGKPLPTDFLEALEGGFLTKNDGKEPEGETRYQYCTAFPVGTQLAQSWDMDLIASVGRAVGEELVKFDVTLWLAPGMNIHRNPLCGRNFEYYAEDPLLSGFCAAAMTDGVQSIDGVGTTIKHFACNNQEDNRMGSDSIVSERALREIYLKGFEICIRKAQPMAIMTSYNLINGVHAANNYDICTKAARNEWGFQGVIMTDWTTTMAGPDCTASGCMRAGNDLVMPGAKTDHENLRAELEAGTLKIEDLKRSIARLVNCVWLSNDVEREEE